MYDLLILGSLESAGLELCEKVRENLLVPELEVCFSSNDSLCRKTGTSKETGERKVGQKLH